MMESHSTKITHPKQNYQSDTVVYTVQYMLSSHYCKCWTAGMSNSMGFCLRFQFSVYVLKTKRFIIYNNTVLAAQHFAKSCYEYIFIF